jgi:hypothetical protein
MYSSKRIKVFNKTSVEITNHKALFEIKTFSNSGINKVAMVKNALLPMSF